jgi:hypothetical protein
LVERCALLGEGLLDGLQAGPKLGGQLAFLVGAPQVDFDVGRFFLFCELGERFVDFLFQAFLSAVVLLR